MTSSGTDPGASPFIAGSGMSAHEFGEFIYDSDEPLGASSPLPDLDSSANADALQALNQSVTNNPKSFFSPQVTFTKVSQVVTATGPESPSGSFQDSSSDSASSKRTGSYTSSKTALTAGDIIMTNVADVKTERIPFPVQLGNGHMSAENVFMFGANGDLPAMEDMYDFDDKLMEESFDFDSASSSPNAAGANGGMASPEMPTIKTNTPMKSWQTSKSRPQGHIKNHSVSNLPYSLSRFH
jgi:hypothetical protein